jgi:hypothetical protein
MVIRSRMTDPNGLPNFNSLARFAGVVRIGP